LEQADLISRLTVDFSSWKFLVAVFFFDEIHLISKTDNWSLVIGQSVIRTFGQITTGLSTSDKGLLTKDKGQTFTGH
jgi:hypothetical protein